MDHLIFDGGGTQIRKKYQLVISNGPQVNQSDLYCMHMNARSLKKNIHSQGNLYTSNLLKFQEMIYSEMLDMFVSDCLYLRSMADNDLRSMTVMT